MVYEEEFGTCKNEIEVFDLPYSGCFFTWNNHREEEAFVAHKLDRALGNVQRLEMVEHTEVEFLPEGVSDHSSAVISIGIS
jgi:hypothetical protein